MATYLPGQTDQVPVIQPFQPDFGMVQKALTTLQSKYDQGFASVQNAYNQVLNAPLTNTKLKLYRDAYIKDSEKKLKDLSSVDLSLYENQAAAENVFAPFWQDDRFLTDTYLTKSIQSEMQKGMAARDSKDEKVRDQYNGISMMYLQNGLDQIQQTDPDSPEFAKLQARRWVPFTNVEKYLEEAADKSKLEIKWKSPSGPYLVDVTNGQRALVPFKTWAHNMIGNNFTEQFNVMGTVEREDGVKRLMRNHPDLTEDQATTMLAANTMQGLDKGYTERTNDLDSSIKQVDAQMNWYMNRQLTPEQEADFRKLAGQKSELADQQRNIINEHTKFANNYDATLNQIKENPDNYFASINKQRVIDGWAAARASRQSVDVQLDPVLKERNENAYKDAELKYKYADLDLKERMFQAHLVDTDGDGVPDAYPAGARAGGTGAGGLGSTGGRAGSGKPQTVLSGHNIGKGITDVSQTGSAYDALVRQQNDRWHAAHENFFDMSGVGRVLTAKLGEDPTLARNYISELRRKMNDPEHYTIDNKDGWFDKISTELEKSSNTKITDAASARNALIAVAGQYLSEKLQNGGALTDNDDRTMLQKYMVGKSALYQYEATQKNIQEQTEKLFNTSHDYDVMRQDHGGKKGIITSDDLAKVFKAKTYDIGGTEMSADQLAKLYMDGQISLSHPPKTGKVGAPMVVYAGKGGSSRVLYNEYDNPTSDLYGAFDELDKKYGSSEKFKEKIDGLNKKIVPGIFEYQNQTGKYGYRVQYALRPDVDNEFSASLLNEAASADNRLDIYDGTQRSTNKDLNTAVLTLLQQGETELEKHISSVVLNTSGPNGNPTLDLTFIPVKDTDKTKIGDYDLKDLAGKHISIELNPNASGAAIQSIHTNPGFYVYGDLLRGKSMNADPMLKAAGFDFSILPNDDKNPTYAQLTIRRTVFDETTGKNKVLTPIDRPIYFAQQTPDEIMGMVYNLLDAHLAGNVAANQRYLAHPPAGLKTGRQILDEMASAKPPSTINGQ
jgi:hypothetical protein